MDNRKELKNRYRNRTIIGGIYSIRCSGNGRVWTRSTGDLQGQINRFQFSRSTGYCPEPGMREEWNQYGAESFSLSVLEELEKKETQTEREFADDINVLFETWLEKKDAQQEDDNGKGT